jgi:hypothetical protein
VTALLLTLFVSLVLGALGVLGFVRGVVAGDHEHADRLSLLPLQNDRTDQETCDDRRDR